MRSCLQYVDVVALADLGQWHDTGIAAPSPQGRVAAKLMTHRLAQPDDYGDLRIIERGRHHLRHLQESHVAGRLTRAARRHAR